MTPHRSFQVPLFAGGDFSSRRRAAATADIRNVLRTVAECRQDVSFEILEQCDAFQSASSKAGILCSSSNHQRSVESLGSAIGTCHVRTPGGRQNLEDGAWEDGLDLHVILTDDLEDTLRGPSSASSQEKAQQWISSYASANGWSELPLEVTIVRHEDARRAEVKMHSFGPASQQPHVTDQPFSVRHAALDQVLELLHDEPSSLNGLVITSTDAGSALIEHVLRLERVCATFGHLKGSPDPQIIFELQMIETMQYNGPGAIDLALTMQSLLSALRMTKESRAVGEALARTVDPSAYLGSNLLPVSSGGSTPDKVFMEMLLHHLKFFLEAANSQDAIRRPKLPDHSHNVSIRPMNLVEKIVTHSAVGLTVPEVEPGQMICVKVDWVLTSELLWGGMEKTYNEMNRPRPYRNDRVWLAVDHTVDPRTAHLPKQKRLMQGSERFRDEAKIINYLPANTSIMHTDFTREKAQPGTIVVGSDSHTCSSGSMGSLAVGFGAADVVMPLVTGQTWFRVPEVCRINFVGRPAYGISGKDIILYVLGIFKRNTIAFQRAVEYGGPALDELSMDARFAIANMTTEFGGMGACFEADQQTSKWISKRRSRQYRTGGFYFRPDPAATYAEVRSIDLSKVTFTMAIYPNPDDVVQISEQAGMHLDGCFIGACTTTEQELILGALVLEAGLRSGLVPTAKGNRRVTPGSMIITNRLDKLGLLDTYREAGFDIGAPGCSYCVGINDVDVAQEGEVWLSSQNRNFKNRMGKGSIGNITSAAAVAASSFSMRVTDPKPLLNEIREERLKLLDAPEDQRSRSITIQEPQPCASDARLFTSYAEANDVGSRKSEATPQKTGNVQRFGTNVDTDAIIPAEFMPGVDNLDLGSHCFEYYRPEFRSRVAEGSTIIVAEGGFGSGSSREDAVRALQGAGVQAVIAKSFAFIYHRNQLNMGLFNVVLKDEKFYEHAAEGKTISIDKAAKTIAVESCLTKFKYEQAQIEEELLNAGGILPLYKLYGRNVFTEIIKSKQGEGGAGANCMDRVPEGVFEVDAGRNKLDW